MGENQKGLQVSEIAPLVLCLFNILNKSGTWFRSFFYPTYC